MATMTKTLAYTTRTDISRANNFWNWLQNSGYHAEARMGHELVSINVNIVTLRDASRVEAAYSRYVTPDAITESSARRGAYKRYYIIRGSFGNCYRLIWAEAGQTVPEDAERITRTEAVRLAREERARREYDPQFSGFASAHILPIDWPEGDEPGTTDIIVEY